MGSIISKRNITLCKVYSEYRSALWNANAEYTATVSYAYDRYAYNSTLREHTSEEQIYKEYKSTTDHAWSVYQDKLKGAEEKRKFDSQLNQK